MPYEYIAPDQSGNNELDMDKLFDAFADWAKQLNYDIPLAEQTIEDVKNTSTKAIEDLKNRFNSIADYVVEQGTSSGWTYRKWNSGVAECWTLISEENVIFNFLWSSGVSSYIERDFYYPSGFFIDGSIPCSAVFVNSFNNNIFTASAYEHTNRHISLYIAAVDEGYAYSSGTTYTLKLAIHATGRWK